MNPQSVLKSEESFANIALMRLLPGVYLHVVVQRQLSCESVPTLLTREASFARVLGLMSFEVTGLNEGPVAHCTLIRTIRAMDLLLVHRELGASEKLFTTIRLWTGMVLLSLVSTAVLGQTVFILELLSALVTFIRLLVRVRNHVNFEASSMSELGATDLTEECRSLSGT